MTDYDRAGNGRALDRPRPGWVGPNRAVPHIGLTAGPREPGQAKASAKDRSAPGICGIFPAYDEHFVRHEMLDPARTCPNLARHIRTQTGPVLSCLTLQHCLTLPSPVVPVQFC